MLVSIMKNFFQGRRNLKYLNYDFQTPEIIPTPPRAPSHTEVLERLLSERE